MQHDPDLDGVVIVVVVFDAGDVSHSELAEVGVAQVGHGREGEGEEVGGAGRQGQGEVADLKARERPAVVFLHA